MTDEDAFQHALDAAPDDHVTRGAFGDWLCDRDDPRGPGYQVMARLRLRPTLLENRYVWWSAATYKFPFPPDKYETINYSMLPGRWLDLIEGKDTRKQLKVAREFWETEGTGRRNAEDAAAVAFAKLPQKMRTKILNMNPATHPTTQPTGAF